MSAFFAIWRPFIGIKTLQNHFYLVEDVLSFNVKIFQEFDLGMSFLPLQVKIR